MITETVLDQALKENAPHVLMEALQNPGTWVYPQKTVMTANIFHLYENNLLKKGSEEPDPSWWVVFWESQNHISWRCVLNKLLTNCAVRYSVNTQWVDLWNKDPHTADEIYHFAHQCVVENNIKWLESLCYHPTLQAHPEFYERLFKDSVRTKSLESFAFLCRHIKGSNTPQAIGAVLQACVNHNFICGARHIVQATPKKRLKETYTLIDDFNQLKLAQNYNMDNAQNYNMDNDTLIMLLTEGQLSRCVNKDVWIKVSQQYLKRVFDLYMSDIVVFRLSPPQGPPVEDVLFSHKHWNGLRMEWLSSTLNSAALSTLENSVANTMKRKWVTILLPYTTLSERTKWVRSHLHLRSTLTLLPLFEHPLMQKSVLQSELKDMTQHTRKKSARKM